MKVLLPVLTIGILGLLFGLGLAYTLKIFSVRTDPRISKIIEILPGSNCGVCGFGGCAMYAEALAAGADTAATLCKPGGNKVAQNLAAYLDLEHETVHKKIAVVHCGADGSQRKKLALYSGPASCRAANLTLNGGLACKFACLGYGDCAKICPFGAINMVNGFPGVAPDKCVACGKCIAVCPRDIISLEIFEKRKITFVACSSTDRGPFVKRICPVGCIGCGICEKLSGEVFKVTDNLARADYTKESAQIDLALVREKCPMHTILTLDTNSY